MKTLERIQFGNPILRKHSRKLSAASVRTDSIQDLIKNMRHTLINQKLGVGLAAPQVGESVALVVIALRPLPHRPNVKQFDLILINPSITELSGKQSERWEGCISAGSNGVADLFAKVPRFSKIKVKYLDENGDSQFKSFSGLKAQVIQHEVDHLNGVLFIDKVEKPKTFMTYSEYMKRIRRVNSGTTR